MRYAPMLLGALVLAISVFPGCGGSPTLSQKNFILATGSKSGVYHPIGEALARLMKENFPNVQVQVQETEGSIQNLDLLQSGKVTLALVQNDIAYYALNGEKMFEDKKVTHIKGIATLFPEIVHIVTRKDLEIDSLSKLVGRKVAVGNNNSGTYFNAKQILSLAEVWDTIDPQYFSPSESMKALESQEIDAFIFTTGLPNPTIAELAQRTELVFLPLPPELIQKIVNAYPFYFPSNIPMESYSGMAAPVSGVEINAILTCSDSLPEQDQYLLTKALFATPSDLGSSHPRLGLVTKHSLRRQMPIPLGAGALRAFSETP